MSCESCRPDIDVSTVELVKGRIDSAVYEATVTKVRIMRDVSLSLWCLHNISGQEKI